MKFAAFIMTYKRSETAKNTIQVLLKQTVKPQKILIVDNDPDKSAQILSDAFPDENIEYYSVGYNSGPAGAAALGLQILADEGFDFIAWLDDDDPPFFYNSFEIVLDVLIKNNNCGCAGVVGQHFDKSAGLIRRVSDEELMNDGFLSVSNIAGNMIKIIRADIVKIKGIIPERKLFFGFEELDFDLKIINAGYLLLVDKKHFLSHRKLHNRINLKKSKSIKKNSQQLIRDYYSTRNLLYISLINKYYMAFISVFIRSFIKSIIGFKFGFIHGRANFKYQTKAIIHFLFSKYSRTF